VQQGDAARQALAEEARQRSSRRDLARTPGFEQVSPEVGALDVDAFDDLLAEDADAALALLARLTGAVDERLRRLARRLAARVVLDVARRGPARTGGVGRQRLQPADRAEGDLDLDASLEALALARATRSRPALEDLAVRSWSRPATALALVVDRSGSMGGDRLATAALAAACCALRAGDDVSVLAFGRDVLVLEAQDEARPAEAVVDELLQLRGVGTTDLAAALREAAAQLARSRASRRAVLLVSDCRATAGEDPVRAASALEELSILAPEGDSAEAEALAAATGARWTALRGPADVPAAMYRLLDR
jgi:Mg-chelatase subunit ChlD